MKKMTIILMLSAVVVLGTGCAGKYKKVEQDMKAPINCATAKGDLRILEHEKAHTMDQISQGVSAVMPIGLVVGLVEKTEGTSWRVATGEYNKMIDKRIKEIKEHCGIK